ncbi:hypothetical protein EAN95_14575 [Klebsiella quasipneumoniae]|nr:hypothetical protein EAN95_14575 [Klebsiella quasipneumoniae]
MMSLWDALRMNMMISYQELVRTFPNGITFPFIGFIIPSILFFSAEMCDSAGASALPVHTEAGSYFRLRI